MDNDEQRDYAEEAYWQNYCPECDAPHEGDCPEPCVWCNEEEDDDPDPETLCLDHQAEYEGISVNELLRRTRKEAYDLL